VSLNEFDPLGEGDEREWMRYRSEARRAARRFRLTVALLVIGALALIWVTFSGLNRGNQKPNSRSAAATTSASKATRAAATTKPRATTPARSTGPALPAADQAVVNDTQRALQEWGQFAISGDLSAVRGYFWTGGPQYRELVKEAPGVRQKGAGPPPYQFRLFSPRVIKSAEDERIVRGVVDVARPGEATQVFHWDIYVRLDSVAGKDRWRLWTVKTTDGQRQ
jgi:hypothetical protein